MDREKSKKETERRSREFALARKRVGEGPEEAAHWLLEFAAKDISASGGGQLIDMWWEVYAFGIIEGYLPTEESSNFLKIIPTAGVPEKYEEEMRRQEMLGVVHGILSNFLQHLFDSSEGISSFPKVNAHLISVRDSESGRIRKFIDATVEERFFVRAHDLVTEMGERIRQCENTTCERVFFAIKRQSYCGPRCSQQVRTARFRSKENPKEAIQKRRELYEHKQKEKVYRNVKVGRNQKRRKK